MYIHVKVQAQAGKETFSQKSKDRYEVAVRHRAQGNSANHRVVEIFAKHFKVPISKVRIIHGHQHPSKLLLVEPNP